MLEKIIDIGKTIINKEIYSAKVIPIGKSEKSGLVYSGEVCRTIIKRFNKKIESSYLLGELNLFKKDENNEYRPDKINIRRFKTVQADRAIIKLLLFYIKDEWVYVDFKFIKNRAFKNNVQDMKYQIKKKLYSPDLILRFICDYTEDKVVINNDKLNPITVDINFNVKKEH